MLANPDSDPSNLRLRLPRAIILRMPDPIPTPAALPLWEAHTRVTQAQIEAFCQRWGLLELTLYGSVVRDDFQSGSDVDVLVKLNPRREYGPWDWIEMIDELQELFGRRVDLTSHRILENPFRRQTILRDMQVIYAA